MKFVVIGLLLALQLCIITAAASSEWRSRSRPRVSSNDGPLGGHLNYITGRLFVGDQWAAAGIDELRQYNITAILNVAWDLDLRYNLSDFRGGVATNDEHLFLEYNKVGLVDGEGNQVSSLASAVYMLDQLLTKRTLEPKDQPTYNQPVQNVLVHCHSGHSRSVTTAALWLYYRMRSTYPSYKDALLFVKTQRNVENDPSVPEPMLTATAEQLLNIEIFSLFP